MTPPSPVCVCVYDDCVYETPPSPAPRQQHVCRTYTHIHIYTYTHLHLYTCITRHIKVRGRIPLGLPHAYAPMRPCTHACTPLPVHPPVYLQHTRLGCQGCDYRARGLPVLQARGGVISGGSMGASCGAACSSAPAAAAPRRHIHHAAAHHPPRCTTKHAAPLPAWPGGRMRTISDLSQAAGA